MWIKDAVQPVDLKNTEGKKQKKTPKTPPNIVSQLSAVFFVCLFVLNLFCGQKIKKL